jgi:uncharacterized cupredoxin-like copper-binding protein
MRVRYRFSIPAAALLAVSMVFGSGGASPAPAQTKRVIHIAASSFKFEPNLFFVNEGDTVVLALENVDSERPHAFNSPYLSQVDFTVAGQYKQGEAKDGSKYIQLEPGQKAELTFVAKGRGQYGFVCSLYNHASRGQTGAFVVWPAGYHPPQK